MLTVHAICQTTSQLEFDVEGLADSGRVYTIHHEEYCAIVSTIDEDVSAKMDRESALRLLLIHQRIVEAAMPYGALIPIKFGTILPDEHEVIQLIEQACELIDAAFRQYKGKIQMEVSVLWDTSEVFLALSQMLSVVEMKKKAEEGDQDARRQLGIHVKGLMDQKRETYAAEILPSLRSVTETIVVQPIMADEVVLNVALLMDASQESMLDNVLNQIDREYEGQFQIRCVGPMPLYSFSTLKAEKVSPEAIDKACQVLELPSPATLEGIKRAYRKKVHVLHPDRAELENIELNEKMAEVTAAYQLLTHFAKSQLINSKKVGGERCHFDKEAVEKTLLINFERQLTETEEPVS